jgi:hypothetical protein
MLKENKGRSSEGIYDIVSVGNLVPASASHLFLEGSISFVYVIHIQTKYSRKIQGQMFQVPVGSMLK